MNANAPVPVTLLAGFLGSGKTTLVNRILAEPHGERIAVVVNEFGDVGIDGSLVVGVSDDIVELRNGCLCCTVRGDLAETLADLLERRGRRFLGRKRFDRILIEASGLASPGPALQTLLIDPRLQERLETGHVITLAHAALVKRQIAEHPEAAEQLAYADRILLNHVDQSDDAGVDEARASVRACNPLAPIDGCSFSEVPVPELLETPRLKAVPSIDVEAAVEHSCGVGTLSLKSTEPADFHRLKMWLQFVASNRSQELMRVKGIVHCEGMPDPVVVQAVYQFLQIGPGTMEMPDESRVVLIGRNLDVAALERGWETCYSSVRS